MLLKWINLTMKAIYTFTFLCFATVLFSQNDLSNYWITFIDKKDTPYSIFTPQAYLSPRAIAKRQQFHIPIDSLDLPISPSYLNEVRAVGVKIRHTSKWLNAATGLATDSIARLVANLPFVRTIERVGKYHTPTLTKVNKRIIPAQDYPKLDTYYGYGSLQIGMVNGHAIHRLGYQGKEVYVGVQDGGFTKLDINPFFDSLRLDNRIIATKDFVDGDDYVYESATHGSSVLSIMAGNLPYLFVGTAPEASYVCLKTEDVRSESLTEECNWVAAIEYADSVGVDVINSSLGYTTFSEESMDYEYSDLNGRNSSASLAADIAFHKGLFVVNSGGNSGDKAWRFVGTPADSREIFSIGAINFDRFRASFSSFGPTADGRIKPNIAAPGARVAVAANGTYEIGLSSGTSLAAPLIAGLVATLKEAFPNTDNRRIRLAIEQSATQATRPDNVLGYGIPDFYKAYQLLKGKNKETADFIDVYALDNVVEIVFLKPLAEKRFLKIYDWSAKLLFEEEVLPKQQFEQLKWEYNLPSGVYYLEVSEEGLKRRTFFVK